jgi:adenylate cyclase class 2
MNPDEVEIEVKFFVKDLPGVEQRLRSVGAEQTQPRTHELNWRFDTPGGELTAARRVLRLRQDSAAWLTYKGPAAGDQAVSIRQEIQFEVSDLNAARRFLEALGYQVSITYEKYRTVYAVGEVQVALDEMPYGAFVEIEAPDADSIEIMAAVLRLNWQARTNASYLELFNRLRQRRSLEARNLSFEELQGYRFSAADFGLEAADDWPG